jgi:hypothetical protein
VKGAELLHRLAESGRHCNTRGLGRAHACWGCLQLCLWLVTWACSICRLCSVLLVRLWGAYWVPAAEARARSHYRDVSMQVNILHTKQAAAAVACNGGSCSIFVLFLQPLVLCRHDDGPPPWHDGPRAHDGHEPHGSPWLPTRCVCRGHRKRTRVLLAAC